MASTPRVLKLSFEFHVAADSISNIQGRHLERAVDRIETAVRTMGADAFPWADRLVVNREWNYAWWANTDLAHDEYELPANEYNAP
ncbi:hypothetical protein [Nocardia amamiensis]|uniref:hypothetical protein n=1 Tax=Nocardia amamiensis TaxID=404578 RepID=UPI00082B5563|nr:hypothetical protein [Nocardia amamiensis]